MDPEQGWFLDSVVAARQFRLSNKQHHLLMPLNSFGKITAIMEIQDDKEIVAEEIKILEIFAMQTASAIDNTRLKLHLEYVSFHDQLTDLYNRAYFENEILRIEKRAQYPAALIVCDLDGLKMINDACGHAAGDHFIVAAAKLIKSAVPPSAVTARIGGDEFAIIITEELANSAEQIAFTITQAVDKYNSGSPVLPLGMSVGWAISSNQEKMRDIFKMADSRMYRDKYSNGKARREYILKTIAKYPGIRLG
jgi:diguanylate cyclase (GGDEF)-like protein